MLKAWGRKKKQVATGVKRAYFDGTRAKDSGDELKA